MCSELAVDLVRNGEGTTHVIRVEVSGAPSAELARDVGKAVVNGNLFCSAVAGNDPNVGRLVGAVGSFLGRVAPDLDLSGCTMRLGGRTIFAGGAFELDAEATRDETSGRDRIATPARVAVGGRMKVAIASAARGGVANPRGWAWTSSVERGKISWRESFRVR